MKNTTQVLILIFTITFVSSCSDDTTNPSENNLPYFTINDGNVWYYDKMDSEEGVDFIDKKIEEHTLNPSTVGGKDCLKYYIVDEGDEPDNDDFKYVRTDDSGYYIFDEDFYESYSDVLKGLKDVWVKYVDFKNNSWTQLDIRKDTSLLNGKSIQLEFKLIGETTGQEEVEYKNRKYDAYVTRVNLIINDTTTFNGVTDIENISRGIEFTTIKDIGIYKIRQLSDGVYRDRYQVLTDHK